MKKSKNINRLECIIRFISEHYVEYDRLRHDVVSNTIQIQDLDPNETFESAMNAALVWRPVTTTDVNNIVCACSLEYGICVSPAEVLTVLKSSHLPDVHPLREYIHACKPYTEDQPDWIEWLAKQVTVEGTDYDKRLWMNCFKKWFVAMVAAWLDDNVVNQQVLVLIGKQGIFKTTWLEHLIPPQLRNYSCKMANTASLNKDEKMRIAEYGLIALDEIDAMTNRELNVMKSVITASDISERPVYGYTKERRPRLASFCASGNKKEFLTDITGNRRWLPFQVKSIQNPFYTKLPYEQIYAQAKYHIDNGFNFWFDLDDIDEMELHNEDFRAQPSEEDLLFVYFDIPEEGQGQFMTTAEISAKLISWGAIKYPMNGVQMGMLLGKSGFQSKRGTDGQKRGWLVRERPLDEVQANRNLAPRI